MFIVFLLINWRKMVNYKVQNNESDYAMGFVMNAVVLEFVSLICILIHQYIYSKNGIGIAWLELAS